MSEIISVIVVIALAIALTIGFFLLAKNPNVNNKVNDWLNQKPNYTTPEQPAHDGVIYDKNEPLDRNTFIQQAKYADKKQDSRFDELLISVDKILFWTRIVGFYFLVKILIVVIKIITAILAGNYLIDALTKAL